jgi:transcriptional regulator with XRE-family HTH domain
VTKDSAPTQPASPPLGTLAEKLDWLIGQAHPAGRGPYSNAEAAALVRQVTGMKISYGAIWELRTGRTINPTKRVIEALAQTFGVPSGFFFDDYGHEPAQRLAEQARLLALIHDTQIDHTQLRAFLSLSPQARQAMASLIDYTARAEASRKAPPPGQD